MLDVRPAEPLYCLLKLTVVTPVRVATGRKNREKSGNFMMVREVSEMSGIFDHMVREFSILAFSIRNIQF